MEFIFPIHVYTEDTDYGGIVYHPNFIKFLERARTSWASQLGWGLDKLAKESIFFVVRNINIDYLFPARLGDDLEVVTRVEKIGHTSIVFQQEIHFDREKDKILCKAQVTIVCIDETLKPRQLPQALVEKFNYGS